MQAREQLIPDMLHRLEVSAVDVHKEENKDGGNARKQFVKWCQRGVSMLTE